MKTRRELLKFVNSVTVGRKPMTLQYIDRNIDQTKQTIMRMAESHPEPRNAREFIKGMGFYDTDITRPFVVLSLAELVNEGEMTATDDDRFCIYREFLGQWEGEDVYTTDRRIAKIIKHLHELAHGSDVTNWKPS